MSVHGFLVSFPAWFQEKISGLQGLTVCFCVAGKQLGFGFSTPLDKLVLKLKNATVPATLSDVRVTCSICLQPVMHNKPQIHRSHCLLTLYYTIGARAFASCAVRCRRPSTAMLLLCIRCVVHVVFVSHGVIVYLWRQAQSEVEDILSVFCTASSFTPSTPVSFSTVSHHFYFHATSACLICSTGSTSIVKETNETQSQNQEKVVT